MLKDALPGSTKTTRFAMESAEASGHKTARSCAPTDYDFKGRMSLCLALEIKVYSAMYANALEMLKYLHDVNSGQDGAVTD